MARTADIYNYHAAIKANKNVSLFKLEDELNKVFAHPKNTPESERDAEYYRRRRYSPNTFQSYKSAVFNFVEWSGIENPFPTTATTIIEYLIDNKSLAPSTLNHRVAALSFVHRALDFLDPTQNEVFKCKIRDVLGGIRKEHIEEKGWSEIQAPAINLCDFIVVLNSMGGSLIELRDKAFMLVSLLGAFRQSEVLNLNVEHLIKKEQGYIIPMGVVKNDQLSKHKKFKALPKLDNDSSIICPVKALNIWIKKAKITSGPIFRGVLKSGEIRNNKLSHTSGNRIIKKRLSEGGIENADEYSCHSFRSTFITSLREADVSDAKIVRQTHHKNLATLNIYDRPEVAFKNNPSLILANEIKQLLIKK